MKLFIIPTIMLTLTGCSPDSSATAPYSSKHQDTSAVKKWLTHVILDYVNGDRQKTTGDALQSAMTANYYEYKLDDIVLGYSDMTRAEFNQKWKSRYDTRYVGKSNFFGSAQDSGPTEIPVCTFLKSSGDTAQIFHVVTHDVRWNANRVMDITVLTKDNRLFIDDVREYE